MSTIQTLTKLRQLRLSAMAQALQLQLEHPGTYDDLSFLERVDLLINTELENRHQRRQHRRIKAAEFSLPASLNEIEYDPKRNVSRHQIAPLGQCDWLTRAENLLVTGPTGAGKTYIASALGYSACLLDYSVYYARVPHLLRQFDQARATGTFSKTLQRFGAVALLIIDDWGLQPLNDNQRHDLLELMEQRYRRTSTALISQLPTDQWYASVGDATLADAILDRLMHNAHRIELKGESMRKKYTVHSTTQ